MMEQNVAKSILLDQEATFVMGDPEGMLAMLKEFPSQCSRALEMASRFSPTLPKLLHPFTRVVICGMGGSAIAGDVLKIFLSVPCEVCRDYRLPPTVDARTLLIAVSYSGNTEETLSATQQGLERGFQPLCISNNGALKEIAEKRGLAYLNIPPGLQPRAAFAYLVIPLLQIAAHYNLMTEPLQWEKIFAYLSQMSKKIAPAVLQRDNLAKQFSYELSGHIPLIYAASELSESVARRWKTQLNENAKHMAFSSIIPELCHNEIVPLMQPASQRLVPWVIILIRNADEHAQNTKRVEILKKLLQEHNVPFHEVPQLGESSLSSALAQIHLGDYVSVYLAFLNKVNPTPVKALENFKTLMRS
jgi:glucose/mannose-6-phosphate isomerase